jgi:hypothetical protein
MLSIIQAEMHVEPLGKGSSNPQIIADNNLSQWVVKSMGSFQGSVGGSRFLFNEYVATRMAEAIGMPVLPVGAISISTDFLRLYPFLTKPEYGGFTPGLHFASAHRVGNPLSHFMLSRTLDSIKSKTVNGHESNAVISFDTWVMNSDRAFDVYTQLTDGRLVANKHGENPDNLLFETVGPGLHRLIMIDHGLAFNGDWHDDLAKDPNFHVDNWPIFLKGHLDIFFKFGWIDLQSCLNWVRKICNFTLTQIYSIFSEVPLAWKIGISDAEQESLALCLLKRLHYLSLVIRHSLPSLQNAALVRL